MAPSERAPRRQPTLSQRRARSDRDGDVKMGLEPKPTRGRIGKATSAPGAAGTKDPPRGPASMTRGARGPLNTAALQRNIARAAARGDVSMRNGNTRPPKTSDLVEFRVTGWDKNTTSHSTKDNGVSSLEQWLESKMKRKLASARSRETKIKKTRLEGNILYVYVSKVDAGALERMNGYSWAKVTITIERVGGPVSGISSQAEEVKAILQGVLESRYREAEKFLDLSALGQDPQLKAQAIFDSKSTASKFFPALMKVLEQAFDKSEERDAAIKSVSLANNDLTDLKAVSTLSFTLPKLENLDLSNNQFANLKALDNWRRRFLHLSHIIVTSNPLEQNEPNYATEFLKWYPNLRMINQTQVRTEQEVASKSSLDNIPFCVKAPQFQDEGGIVENFIKTFFAGFDTDRPQLATHFYDAQSTFSMSVNISAPRDASVESGKGDWDAYIKHSRNLKKINHPGARNSRLARGPRAVAEIMTSLPKSKHPDLLAEPRKWMIESHLQPGIPDPSGQSPGGVDGFAVSIHGEFDELDANTNQATKKRSFDHFFTIGPALPGSASIVRVVSHMMTVRQYGGLQAFDPDHFADARPQTPPQEVPPTAPELPAGITIPMAEQMIAEFSKATGMTFEYSKMCFDGVGWDAQKAQETFNSVKATLPPEAWMPGAVA